MFKSVCLSRLWFNWHVLWCVRLAVKGLTKNATMKSSLTLLQWRWWATKNFNIIISTYAWVVIPIKQHSLYILIAYNYISNPLTSSNLFNVLFFQWCLFIFLQSPENVSFLHCTKNIVTLSKRLLPSFHFRETEVHPVFRESVQRYPHDAKNKERKTRAERSWAHFIF